MTFHEDSYIECFSEQTCAHSAHCIRLRIFFGLATLISPSPGPLGVCLSQLAFCRALVANRR